MSCASALQTLSTYYPHVLSLNFALHFLSIDSLILWPMVQDTIPLLDRLSDPPLKDTIPLLDHLSDHPLKDPSLTEQMSLLERMNVKPFAQNSALLSPSSEKKESCQSLKRPQKLVHSSTRILSSPTPKKRKLSTFMLMNSTPSTTTPRTWRGAHAAVLSNLSTIYMLS